MKACRVKRSGLNVQQFHSASQLPPEWDSFLPEGHFLQQTRCQVTETTSLPDLQFLYILISNKEQPVAAAYFQVLALTPSHLNAAMIKPWQATSWNLFTSTTRPKLLIGGHLFRHDIASFYYAPGLKDFEAYQCYMEAIRHATKASCANAVLIKDTPAALSTYFQHFAPRYLLLRNDISMELDIPAAWTSITDYEKDLKHKYAQRMRKIRQSWPSLSVKELSTDEVRANEAILYGLYKKVTENQQVRLGFLSPQYLTVLKQCHQHELRIWAIYEGEAMIAFFSAWVREDVFDMFYIGFDYEKNREYQLYFNMLFFGIEQAIALRKQKIIFGRTALDAKARLGCKPRYLSTFLYIRNRFVRSRVMAIQQKTSDMEGTWEDKHPFKN